jgi:hypothetical protein
MSATLKGGINLAYWLYKMHPQLFNALQRPAQQAAARGGLGSLGDDFAPATTDFVPFDSSAYVPTVDTSVPFETSSITSGDISSALDPVIVSLPDPSLTNIGIDAALTTPNFSFNTGAPASSSGGLSGALASIGSFLSSATGLTSLSNLATAVYKANTPQASTIATQIGRVQNGVNPAPITYGYNAAGQLVPILAKANTAGVTLTPQTLAGLIPSSLTPYVVPVVIGGVLLWALLGSKK